MVKKKKTEIVKLDKFVKIPYFDEEAAQDYLDVKNGGRLDWSTDENKEKLAKIVGEIEAEIGGGFNFLTMLKTAFKGKGEVEYSSALSKVIDSRLKNTILTDYLTEANKDTAIEKFINFEVYPYPNSFTMYRMFSSYLTIVPKEQLQIDMEKLNQAMLGERGYYELVAENKEKKHIFRFNINAFRNGYNLADLSKMRLVYYGVPVGKLPLTKLGIDQEFDYVKSNDNITAESVLGEEIEHNNAACWVYDIILVGVSRE